MTHTLEDLAHVICSVDGSQVRIQTSDVSGSDKICDLQKLQTKFVGHVEASFDAALQAEQPAGFSQDPPPKKLQEKLPASDCYGQAAESVGAAALLAEMAHVLCRLQTALQTDVWADVQLPQAKPCADLEHHPSAQPPNPLGAWEQSEDPAAQSASRTVGQVFSTLPPVARDVVKRTSQCSADCVLLASSQASDYIKMVL